MIATVITITVFEPKAPHATRLDARVSPAPAFLNQALSFVYVGIDWNHHHHRLHVAKSIDGRILWANLHLLFWLSLIPFASVWMEENHFQTLPIALCGAVLFLCGIAYCVLAPQVMATNARSDADSTVPTRPALRAQQSRQSRP